MNAEEFREAAKQLVDYIVDYVENIRERPVLPSVEPFYIRKLVPDSAPEDGEPWKKVFEDIEKVIMPGMTHWHSPRFHAYFPTANSYPGILGDMLSGALACIGFTWLASPACTELEMQMTDWLGKMLRLPEEFLFSSGGKGGGVIQGTASEATLVALLSARNKALSEKGTKAKLDTLVAYASEQSHSSVERAGLLGAVKVRLLKPDKDLSLRGDTLAAAVDKDIKDGLTPFFVLATLGTTNSCAFDNLTELGVECRKRKLWLHVDAAYAGSAFICPEYRHHLNGVEYADSFNTNPHKWLLINFDCSTMWVRNSHDIVDSFNVNPVYLRHEKQGQIPDYRHWQIPLGRRFRSLKMWFVLRTYGVKKLQEHIRKQVALAQKFGEMMKKDHRFEITHPVVMGLVCFRIKGTNDVNKDFVHLINERKKIHLTPCQIEDQYIVRFAVCARTTEPVDIDYSWKEILEVVDLILKTKEE